MLYLRTMGALSLHEDGPDGPVLLDGSKYLVLLAWLSVAPGKRATRDYLSSLMWPSSERKDRLRSLRQCLYTLGKEGAGSALVSEDDSVSLDPGSLRTDVDDLRSALESRDYERALRLAPGQFLGGTRNGIGHELRHWIDAENERIRVGLTLAYAETIGRYLRRQDPDRAVEVAREYARREPLSEHAQVLLVQALRAAGRDPEALAAYEAYRSLLQDAVGDRPGTELEASAARVREELLRTPSYDIPDLLSQPATDESRSAGPGWLPLVAVAIVAALAIGWALRGSLLGPREGAWVSDLAVRLPVFGATRDSAYWLVIENGRARAGPRADTVNRVGPESLPSPDGRFVAEPFEVPLGYDLRLIDRQTGESRVLFGTPADEKPLDWSPDGRYLAFGFGIGATADGAYWHALGVYDMVADSILFLRDSEKESGRTNAAWSPDGTRIAYVTGPDTALTIGVMDSDGARVRIANPDEIAGSLPLWSPDSRRLLFVSERHGARDLFSVRADGTGLTRLTDVGDVESPYAWIAPDAALFFRGVPVAARPWALNPLTGEIRAIEAPEGVTYDAVSQLWTSHEQPAWIDAVRITGPSDVLASGERALPVLEGITTNGERVRVDPSAVRWTVSDSELARLEGDALVALAAGTVDLIGSAGGWRADTLSIRIAEARVADLVPAFDETWSAGIDTANWTLVGDPLPTADGIGGPESAGVFLNNGDRNYLSGAHTRRAFSLSRGITVDVWGRLPFDGGHWQSFVLRVLDAERALANKASRDPWNVDALDAYVATLDFNGFGRVSVLREAGGDVALPWPEPPDEWRLYSLQVDPEGTASVHYDGSLVGRFPGLADVSAVDSVLVAVGGTSWNTRVEHGRLRVYEGLRYPLE